MKHLGNTYKTRDFKIALFVLLGIVSAGLRGQKLKVIAYNIEFGKSTTPQEMATFLMPEKADIICFNEVPAQGWTKKTGKLLGMEYSYEGKIASANHEENYPDKTNSYFGKYKSILSKYPLENTHEIVLKGVRWSPASAVVATIKASNKKSIVVFSLHIPTGVDDPEKSKAHHLAQLLKKDYANFDMIILAGDFNDRFDSKPMQYLYDLGFTNPYRKLNIDLFHSTTLSPEENKGKVIDHILYKNIKVKKAGIFEEKNLSDHKPVWALFKI